jgi:hypothetical protein
MRIISSAFIALSAGIVLSGCVMQTEIIPMQGQSESQFNRDKEACVQVARSYYGATNNDLTTSDTYLVCLSSKGYETKSKF